MIESITNLATKRSYKGTGVQGKTILRCASSLTVAENRANSWVHKFLCDYFEFDSASIAALNGMEDVFIVGERIDKPSNGDGTFFALGVKILIMILGLMGFASMWAAVFADTGVAMICILNSIRILYKNY